MKKKQKQSMFPNNLKNKMSKEEELSPWVQFKTIRIHELHKPSETRTRQQVDRFLKSVKLNRRSRLVSGTKIQAGGGFGSKGEEINNQLLFNSDRSQVFLQNTHTSKQINEESYQFRSLSSHLEKSRSLHHKRKKIRGVSLLGSSSISAGQGFLSSKNGKLFNYQGFLQKKARHKILPASKVRKSTIYLNNLTFLIQQRSPAHQIKYNGTEKITFKNFFSIPEKDLKQKIKNLHSGPPRILLNMYKT